MALIRLDGYQSWSESSLGAEPTLLDLSLIASNLIVWRSSLILHTRCYYENKHFTSFENAKIKLILTYFNNGIVEDVRRTICADKFNGFDVHLREDEKQEKQL